MLARQCLCPYPGNCAQRPVEAGATINGLKTLALRDPATPLSRGWLKSAPDAFGATDGPCKIMSIELRSIRHARQFFARYRNVGLTEAALLQGSGIAPLQEKKANGLIFGETNGVIERLSCFVVARQ